MARLKIGLKGEKALMKSLGKLSNPDWTGLLEGLGTEIQSQTERRLSVEKTDPDGSPWKEWSKEYAATRGSQHSLLVNDGYLLESITFQAHKKSVKIGSAMDYANYQNEMRQYLGVSNDNQTDLDGIIDDWLESLI